MCVLTGCTLSAKPRRGTGWVLSVSVNESSCPSRVIPFSSLSQTLSSLVSAHQHHDNYATKLQTDPNVDNNLQRIPNFTSVWL